MPDKDKDMNIQNEDDTDFAQSEQGTVPQGTFEASQDDDVKRPNVRLGKGKSALPEGLLNIGMKTVDMPDELSQQTGFYTEEVATLIAQFPQYKFFKALGE